MTSASVPGLPGGSCFLTGRRPELLPFAVIATLCVVAGRLVAVATAVAPTERGAWAAAYLAPDPYSCLCRLLFPLQYSNG